MLTSSGQASSRSSSLAFPIAVADILSDINRGVWATSANGGTI